MNLPTYNLIKVKDVKDSCYIMEDGSLRAVLAVSGINLNLLSEKEQDIVISRFKSFLDGLDFQVQIFIVSRLENLNNYLKILHVKLESEEDFLIRLQLEEYIKFLEEYLRTHKIMKKFFFVVVPYDSLSSQTPKLLKGSKKEEESYQIKLEQLEIRIAYVSQLLSEMNLTSVRLNNNELIELLFEAYNPSLSWGIIPKPIIEKLSEEI